MKLIDEWRSALKFFSIKANLIGVAMAGAYGTYYQQLKDTIPPNLMAYVTGGIFFAAIVLRVISQQPKDDHDQQPPP